MWKKAHIEVLNAVKHGISGRMQVLLSSSGTTKGSLFVLNVFAKLQMSVKCVILTKTIHCFFVSAEQIFWKYLEKRSSSPFPTVFSTLFNNSTAVFIKFKIVVCKLFQFGWVWNLSFGKGLTLSQTSPGFLHVYSTSLLKTLWEKDKLLVTSNLSFFPQCFLPVWITLCHFRQIWNCRLQTFCLEESEICRLGKG